MWKQRGIEPLPADDASIVDCEKINGVGIIIGISFDAVFIMQISPSAFADEHIVPQAIILFNVIFVTRPVVLRNDVNLRHISPLEFRGREFYVKNGRMIL